MIPLDDPIVRIERMLLEARDSLGEAKYQWMLKVNKHAKGMSGAEWVDVKQEVHSKSTQIFNLE